MFHRRAKIDTRDIGLQIAGIFGNHFLKTSHLHYGYWTDDLPVCLENLAEAQRRYTEFLFSHIPAGTRKILDVGCGLGHNAELLIEAGYEVDCVSPSPRLSAEVARKLPTVRLYNCLFEEVKTESRYDLLLFSESFQYLALDTALENCRSLLRPGGRILITDFFRIPAEGESPMGGGHRLSRFLEAVNRHHFEVAQECDMTANTAPNLQLVDEALQDVAIPIRDLVVELLETNCGWLYRMGHRLARLFWHWKLNKLEYKYFSGSRNAASFSRYKTYRLYLLQPKKA